MAMFSISLKDAAMSKAVQIALNRYIKEYGAILHLNLDSENKTIEVEILLEGEVEPLAVKVGKYEIVEENGANYIKVQDVHTSRVWLNTLASSYLEDKKFPVPAEYVKLLKVIV